MQTPLFTAHSAKRGCFRWRFGFRGRPSRCRSGLFRLPAAAWRVVARLFMRLASAAVSFETENGLSTALGRRKLHHGAEAVGKPNSIDQWRAMVAVCGSRSPHVARPGGRHYFGGARLRRRLQTLMQLTIYTPMIVATPVAIGENSRDLTGGSDQQGHR